MLLSGLAEASRSSQASLEGRLLLFEGGAPLLLLLGLLLPLLLLLTDLLLEAVGCVHGVDLSKETLVNGQALPLDNRCGAPTYFGFKEALGSFDSLAGHVDFRETS